MAVHKRASGTGSIRKIRNRWVAFAPCVGDARGQRIASELTYWAAERKLDEWLAKNQKQKEEK